MITSEQYEELKPLVEKSANYFSRRSSFSYDDLKMLFSETLCEVWELYDESRGLKLKTFLYSCFRNAVLSEYQKTKRVENQVDEEIYKNFTETEKDFSKIENAASSNAKKVIRIAIESTGELREDLYNFDLNRQTKRAKLRKFLKELGWENDEINRVFSEIAELITGRRVKPA